MSWTLLGYEHSNRIPNDESSFYLFYRQTDLLFTFYIDVITSHIQQQQHHQYPYLANGDEIHFTHCRVTIGKYNWIMLRSSNLPYIMHISRILCLQIFYLYIGHIHDSSSLPLSLYL